VTTIWRTNIHCVYTKDPVPMKLNRVKTGKLIGSQENRAKRLFFHGSSKRPKLLTSALFAHQRKKKRRKEKCRE